MRLLRWLTALLATLARPLRHRFENLPPGLARIVALLGGAVGLAVLVFVQLPTLPALLLAAVVFSALSGLTLNDAAHLLSSVIPVPMRSTYSTSTAGISTPWRATWIQWRGRVYRHRNTPIGLTGHALAPFV